MVQEKVNAGTHFTASQNKFWNMQDEVVSTFEYYAGLAQKLEEQGDEDLNVPEPNMKIVIKREPLGVCALVTPWNVSSLLSDREQNSNKQAVN